MYLVLFAVLARGLVGVHGGAVEFAEEFDEAGRALVGRGEIKGILPHRDVVVGNAGLREALDDVCFDSPGHGADESFWRRGREGRADSQQLGDKRRIAGDPVTHDDPAARLGDADQFLCDLERPGCEHCAEDRETDVERIVRHTFEPASVAFQEFKPREAGLPGTPVARCDQVARDIDPGHLRAIASEGEGRGSVAATKVEYAHTGGHIESIDKSFSGMAHESGDLREIAFFPESLVGIDGVVGVISFDRRTGNRLRAPFSVTLEFAGPAALITDTIVQCLRCNNHARASP